MPKLFSSKLINNSSNYLNKKSIAKNSIDELITSGSFLTNTNAPLSSTQQLNIDFSKFENHTFFHSAVVKVNETFEKITNDFPYNGTEKEVEDHLNILTGFEKHVFDNYPKNRGYLIFSGTQKGEAQTNGTYLQVKDKVGTEYPSLATDNLYTGKKVLDPKDKSFTTQFFIKVPKKVNDNQIVFQKRSSLANHMTVYLSSSNNTQTCNIGLSITSGSFSLNVTSSIQKGSFRHVSAVYDSLIGESKIITFNTSSQISTVVSSSNRVVFNSLDYNGSDLFVGRGNNVRISNNLVFYPQESFSGSMDELRYFHEEKKLETIKKEKDKTLYVSDSLKLHLRFNEPYGTYNGNDIVLDSSQNNLSTQIKNFNIEKNRLTGSDVPIKSEDISSCIIIFPDFEPVENYYNDLITTASNYDNCNPNIVTKLIPSHYLDVGNVFENFSSNFSNVNKTFDNIKTINFRKSESNLSVQNLLKFLFTWSKYFDQLKLFIDNFSLLNAINYDDKNTVPDIFLQKAAKKLGISLPLLFENASADQFFKGLDIKNNPEQALMTLNNVQNSIWRRILSDVPFVKKKRGTIESVKSIFRNSGIEPDNIFNIREYGGAREKLLEDSTVLRKDVLKMINFSGSVEHKNDSVDSLGKSQTSPFLISNFLSSSRIEIGLPNPRGTYVNKTVYPPHGISNNSSDGLLTSGSFTYQANYFVDVGTAENLSLARLHVTGTSSPSSSESCIINLVANSNNELILNVNDSPTLNKTTSLILTGVNVSNGELWSLSFGRECSEKIGTNQTGSIFLRAAQYSAGNLINKYQTSSYFAEASDSVFTNVSDYNTSGSFIMIGSQSFQSSTLFLNSKSSDKKETYFSGKVSDINFWSYAISEKEFNAFAKNPNSVGTKNPLINYNYNQINTGSFERVRLHTSNKQGTTGSNSLGNIRIFDFSKNNLHLTGKSFEKNKNLTFNHYVIFEELSPDFDLNTAKTKVRIRSLQNENLLEDHKYARISPVNKVNPNEEVVDDLRFAIDMSAMKGLNQNILSIFSDFTGFDNALGKPNLQFSTVYPDLIALRRIYFENLISDIDLNKYREVFKWLDTTFTEIVYQNLPRNTNFLGINLVYESHVLERHKLSYLYDEIYLKSLPRDPSRGVISLSQYVAQVKKL